MSKFIKSFSTPILKDMEIKRFFLFEKNIWSVLIIPTISLYYETQYPETHAPFLMRGFSGIYFTIGWLKWSLYLGLYIKK